MSAELEDFMEGLRGMQLHPTKNYVPSEQRRLPRYILSLTVAGLSLLFRLVFITTTPQGMQLLDADARSYHWLAVNLFKHTVFSAYPEPPYFPNHVWGPLYPTLVATIYLLMGSAPQHVAFFQAFVDTITVSIVFRLGQQLAGYRVGLLAALLYAANPTTWRYTNELLTEILFGLLLTLSVWMLTRYILDNRIQDIFLFALFIGFATLCKPNVLFVPLILLLIMLHK